MGQLIKDEQANTSVNAKEWRADRWTYFARVRGMRKFVWEFCEEP
jgi:hypothetical protein